jgi:hypothetical protein
VQAHDRLGLGGERPQGVPEPLAVEDLRRGEIRPEVFRVSEPLGQGPAVIERRVQ